MTIESKNNWYVLHGDQKHGPYDYGSMIEMLQQSKLMDYNYVWAPHLESWTPVYALPDFSKDRFLAILNSNSELKKHFTPRKNPRISTNISFLGHNHIRFFDGRVTSLSEQGALVLINTPLVQVGDRIAIQIQPDSPDEKPFNLEGKIIRKNFSTERLNSKSGLYYVVHFSDVQPAGKDLIKKWIKQSSPKNLAA